jgi:hypothetical protein
VLRTLPLAHVELLLDREPSVDAHGDVDELQPRPLVGDVENEICLLFGDRALAPLPCAGDQDDAERRESGRCHARGNEN